MEQQLQLFDTQTESRFRAYHEANPRVFELFEKFTFEAIDAGAKRLGAKLVAERVRWQGQIRQGTDGFKINNSYVAYFARLFELKHPEYAGIFKTRTARADVEGVG